MTNEEIKRYYNELITSIEKFDDLCFKLEDAITRLEDEKTRVLWKYYEKEYGVKIGSTVLFNGEKYEIDDFYGFGTERPNVFAYRLDTKGNKTRFRRNLMNRWTPEEK